MIVRDFKGRAYTLLEVGRDTTLLQDMQDNAIIRIRSWRWDEIGFLRALEGVSCV